MNIDRNQQTRDYLTLTFTVAGKQTVITFSNMEIRADVVFREPNYPEIYESAAGVATAIARLQARKVSATIITDIPQTICKLEKIVQITRGKYALRLCLKGYWDCIHTVEWDPLLGTTIGLPLGTIAGATIGQPPGSRNPRIGDPVLINGMGPVIYTKAHDDALARHELANLPFCIDAVLRYDQNLAKRSQARAVGARRNEANTLEFFETRKLTLPTFIDINEQGDTGVEIKD